MPTVIVAVTEKVQPSGKWAVATVKIVKINGTSSDDILQKAETLKQRLLSLYPSGTELAHKVLATFAEDF